MTKSYWVYYWKESHSKSHKGSDISPFCKSLSRIFSLLPGEISKLVQKYQFPSHKWQILNRCQRRGIILSSQICHNLEYLGPAVVSTTLRKNRVLGIDSLDCKIVPMVAISLFFTSGLMPPIDTNSPNAAGSLFPPNHMSSDPFSKTITYCEFK